MPHRHASRVSKLPPFESKDTAATYDRLYWRAFKAVTRSRTAYGISPSATSTSYRRNRCVKVPQPAMRTGSDVDETPIYHCNISLSRRLTVARGTTKLRTREQAGVFDIVLSRKGGMADVGGGARTCNYFSSLEFVY
ncbi:hypothetical protein R3P38DRAFT_2786399 [Favolaschia claudopus]|uniref:Uncharacterized protein n=1 Tax=Favolaschia claudopus TaxID=2862362 RepID=A0AAW0AS99_9AGAR